METSDNNTSPRRAGWFAGGAITLAVLATGGVSYWSAHRYIESTDNAYVKADSSMVAPKVSGYISALLAQDNRPVKAGELLAQIDARDYTVALEHARAEVAVRIAALKDAQARQAAHQAVIAQSAARVEAAGAAVKLASSHSARQQRMSSIGFSSVQQTEESDTDLKVKHAELERETAGLKNAREQIAILAAGVGVAQAQLDQAQATLHRAELELSYTRIVAPIDGVVAARTVRAGQYVQPGTQLMAVVPMDAVYVVANFKETQLERVRSGEPVSIRVDTFPDAKLMGKVDSLAPASGLEFSLLPPDNATGNFTKIVQRIPMKILLAPGQPLLGQLRPGMSVEARIDTTAAH